MNTGKTDAEATEDKKRQDEQAARDRTNDANSFNFNLGLIIIGILQSIAIVYTALVTNKAANAAKVSADAAMAPLKAVFTIKTVSLNNVGVGRTPSAVIVLKNGGGLAASHYTQTGTMGIDAYPVPLQAPAVPAPPFINGTTLAGGDEIRLQLSIGHALGNAEIAALQSNEAAIYVIARVSFIDAFETRHTAEFFLFSNASIGLDQMAAYTPPHA